MATNPYVNKVMKSDGTTIIDISDSTVTPEALKEGFTAYNAAGEKITGSAVPLTSWEQLQQKVRNNNMSDISIGDRYACLNGEEAIVWDVIGKNIDTPANPNLSHALTLRVHNLLPNDLVFNEKQAFYACQSEALSAGSYKVYANTGSGYSSYRYFSLTKPVPVGGQLVWDSSSNQIKSYESALSTTPIETVSFGGGGGNDLGDLYYNKSNGNLNSYLRSQNGSSDWRESAIRQWLNSNKRRGQWWTPQTPWDRPPNYASTLNGFLYSLDPELLDVIGKTQVITKLYDITTGEFNGTYTTEDYFFLMSNSQVNSSYSDEGTKYTSYSGNSSRVLYKNGSATDYWLRSPSSSINVGYVKSNGQMTSKYAYNSLGIAPACNII